MKFFKAAVLTFLLLSSSLSMAIEKINRSSFSGLAIHGYDPVAYFENGNAQPGEKNITFEHEGAKWAFFNEENRDLFEKNPNAYIPQYGGYCAYAASQKAASDVDPTAWQIVNGKLYLNYNNQVQRLWANKLEEHIELGDKYWPEVLQQ